LALILIAGVGILPIYLVIGDLAYLSLLAVNCAALLAILAYLALRLDISVRQSPLEELSRETARAVAGAKAASGV
jgi:hypothetical protein